MTNLENNFNNEMTDTVENNQSITESPRTKTQVSISEVKELLERGYTRTKTAKGYNSEIGSIEEYYNLPSTQVTEMFKHPSLKGIKTKKVVEQMFELVDDTQTVEA